MNFVDISLVLCSPFPFSIKLNAIKFDIIDNSHSLQSSAVNIVSPWLLTPHFAAPPATWRPCSGTAATSTRPTGPCWTPSQSTRGCSGLWPWWWHNAYFHWWPDISRSGLGLSLRADILSLDPGALSLMSGLSGLDGVSLHSLEPLQRLKCPPDPGHGPPPLTRPDPAHRGSHVRTMATKGRDKTWMNVPVTVCIVMRNWNFTNGWGYSYKFCPSYSWWGLCLPTPAPDPETGARETPWWGSVLTTLQCFHLRNTPTPKMFKLIPTKSLMALTDCRATL